MATSLVHPLPDWPLRVVLVGYSGMEVRTCPSSVSVLYNSVWISAFLGMLVILVMLPLPGYIAKRIQGVQVIKMKKVSNYHYPAHAYTDNPVVD